MVEGYVDIAKVKQDMIQLINLIRRHVIVAKKPLKWKNKLNFGKIMFGQHTYSLS